jgi:hypothetical protein
VDESPEEMVDAELAADERLLWCGRPRLGVVFRSSDVFMIPFSILWAGFAVFWETEAITRGAPLFFALWGIPFIAMGLHMTVGRFFVDAWQRKRIYYGVTNERVLIISGVFSRTIKSLNIDTLNDVSLSERRNGTGTITFGSTPQMFDWFSNVSWPGTSKTSLPILDLPTDAREVYDIIRAAQRAAKEGRHSE